MPSALATKPRKPTARRTSAPLSIGRSYTKGELADVLYELPDLPVDGQIVFLGFTCAELADGDLKKAYSSEQTVSHRCELLHPGVREALLCAASRRSASTTIHDATVRWYGDPDPKGTVPAHLLDEAWGIRNYVHFGRWPNEATEVGPYLRKLFGKDITLQMIAEEKAWSELTARIHADLRRSPSAPMDVNVFADPIDEIERKLAFVRSRRDGCWERHPERQMVARTNVAHLEEHVRMIVAEQVAMRQAA